jgi:proteic killer suppression protein
MILSFGDRATEDVFHGRPGRRLRRYSPALIRVAQRKLDMLNAAHQLRDLRSPPGNRLEALSGDLEGFFSVRINQRWRIVFQWDGGDASRVRIVDYHR